MCNQETSHDLRGEENMNSCTIIVIVVLKDVIEPAIFEAAT